MTEQEEGVGLLHIPTECLHIIFQHTDIQTLGALRAVNRSFHDTVDMLDMCQGAPVKEWNSRYGRLVSVLDGSWRDRLFLAASMRGRGSTPPPGSMKVDYSSFCVPDIKAAQNTHVLVTDGYRLQLLDRELHMVQGHIPPQFQQSPHRPFNHPLVSSPVPVNSIPDLSQMRLLLLQPMFHGLHHVRQFLHHPQIYAHPHWPVPTFHHNKERLTRTMKEVFMACVHPGAPPAPPPLNSSNPPPTLPPPPSPPHLAPSLFPTTSTEATAAAEAEGQAAASSSTQPTVSSTLDTLDAAPGPTTQLPATGSRRKVDSLSASAQESQEVNDSGLAVILPRAPLWTVQAGAGASCTDPGGQGKRGKSGSMVPRDQMYQTMPYDTQTDLAFQLLSRALALQCPTYLDISHHSELSDGDIHLVLTKCSQQLQHLVAAGTQLGPLCIMTLGTQDRLNLVSLDLSHSQYRAGSSSLSSAPVNGTRHRPIGAPLLPGNRTSSAGGQGDATDPQRTPHLPIPNTTGSDNPPPIGFPRGSPPAGLISGVAAWEQGLRHRHPSQLQTTASSSQAGSSQAGSSQQRNGDAGASNRLGVPDRDGSPGVRPGSVRAAAAAASVPSLYIRLLRSALGRLTNLKELRLAGNCLSGLFDPPSSITLTPPTSPGSTSAAGSTSGVQGQASTSSMNSQPLEAPLLSTVSRLRLLDVSHSSGLNSSHLAMLIRCATQLEELHAEGCPGLMAPASNPVHVERAAVDAGNSALDTLDNPIHQQRANAPAQQQAGGTTQKGSGLCRLKRLSGGWGFSSRLVCQLCDAASEVMTTLDIHMGAGVTDATLQAVARSCPALKQLKLRMAVITDEGVHAVLASCRTLHVLHLEQCTGPFTAAMLPHPAGSTQWVAATLDATSHQSLPAHRWTLSRLHMSGGPVLLNDHQLRLLIGSRHNTLTHLAVCHCPYLTPSTFTFLAASHGKSLRHVRLEHVGGGDVAGHLHRRWANMHSWEPGGQPAVAGTQGGTAAAEQACAADAAGLLHTQRNSFKETYLRSRGMSGDLEDQIHLKRISDASQAGGGQPVLMSPAAGHGAAWPLPTAAASTSSRMISSQGQRSPAGSDLRGRPAASVWKIKEQDVLDLLGSCPLLRTLQLRHCCTLSAGFVEAAIGCCPLLDSLSLDQCDLEFKGLHITQNPYSPLQQVKVARCKVIEPSLMPQLDAEQSATQSSLGGGTASSQEPDRPSPPAPAAYSTVRRPGAAAPLGLEVELPSSAGAGDLLRRFPRRVDSDVMVHDLLEGRTSVLPV